MTKKKLAFINTQMEKGKFSQNTTRFKDKSKNIQPVIIDTELVNSLIGDETYKAPSVAAVNDALDNKIDRQPVTSGTYLYRETKDGPSIIKTSATNYIGQVAMYGGETSGTNDAGGYVTTAMPKNPYHATPMKYVDDALAGKVSSSTATGGVQVYVREQGEDKTFGLTAIGTKWNVAWYAPPAQQGTAEPNGTLSGAMPANPYNFTPRKYVDGKVSELEHGMMNALGTQYITTEVKDFGASIPIPSGAMKFAYIESLGVIKGYDDDGNELDVAEVHAINVGDTEHSIDDLPKYIEIPDGTQYITLSVTPPEGTIYTKGVGGKIVFQVKVGA